MRCGECMTANIFSTMQIFNFEWSKRCCQFNVQPKICFENIWWILHLELSAGDMCVTIHECLVTTGTSWRNRKQFCWTSLLYISLYIWAAVPRRGYWISEVEAIEEEVGGHAGWSSPPQLGQTEWVADVIVIVWCIPRLVSVQISEAVSRYWWTLFEETASTTYKYVSVLVTFTETHTSSRNSGPKWKTFRLAI